jgi:hypothetical protein
MRQFFRVDARIQACTYVTARREKEKGEKTDTYVFGTNFKERREYGAETMHDRLKCMTNAASSSEKERRRM